MCLIGFACYCIIVCDAMGLCENHNKNLKVALENQKLQDWRVKGVGGGVMTTTTQIQEKNPRGETLRLLVARFFSLEGKVHMVIYAGVLQHQSLQLLMTRVFSIGPNNYWWRSSLASFLTIVGRVVLQPDIVWYRLQSCQIFRRMVIVLHSGPRWQNRWGWRGCCSMDKLLSSYHLPKRSRICIQLTPACLKTVF